MPIGWFIMKNKVNDCPYGLWGEYIYETDITDNNFENNKTAIAIENGRNNNIALNSFTQNRTGIKLSSNENKLVERMDTNLRKVESSNFWIAANRFNSIHTVYDIKGTDTVVFSGNSKWLVENTWVLGDDAQNIDTSREDDFLEMDYQQDERLKSIHTDSLPVTIFPEEHNPIRLTEWGPYDFGYPLLWLKEIDSNGIYHFEVLSKKGNWSIHSVKGFTILGKGEQNFPSILLAKPDTTQPERIIQLNYTGPSFINVFGKFQDSASNRQFQFRELQPVPNTKTSNTLERINSRIFIRRTRVEDTVLRLNRKRNPGTSG